MAPECPVNYVLWKYFFVLYCWTASVVVKTVNGSCGGSSNNQRRGEDSECWYELWYFWFIVVLVFVVIVVLFIFYCKQQVKRSSGRRARRRTPVLTMPIAPPEYEAPGHEPPPYHIAMTASASSDTTVRSGDPGNPYTRQMTSLPGYIMDPAEYHAYDNLSMASTASIITASSPPPYSSPPPVNNNNSQSQHGQADVVL